VKRLYNLSYERVKKGIDSTNFGNPRRRIIENDVGYSEIE
jgi:hypothetical protein